MIKLIMNGLVALSAPINSSENASSLILDYETVSTNCNKLLMEVALAMNLVLFGFFNAV